MIGFSVISLAGNCYVTDKWSDITTRYYIFAPNDYKSIVANLTTGRLYNNMTPLQATVNIFVVMFMFLMLISMILLMVFIGKVRVLGIVVTTAVLCLGNVLAYMEVWVKWLFPTSHAIMEIHFDELYREPILDMSWSYIYYVLAIFVLFVITLLSIDRYDFSKIQELED